jgi:hypothetical protein
MSQKNTPCRSGRNACIDCTFFPIFIETASKKMQVMRGCGLYLSDDREHVGSW